METVALNADALAASLAKSSPFSQKVQTLFDALIKSMEEQTLTGIQNNPDSVSVFNHAVDVLLKLPRKSCLQKQRSRLPLLSLKDYSMVYQVWVGTLSMRISVPDSCLHLLNLLG